MIKLFGCPMHLGVSDREHSNSGLTESVDFLNEKFSGLNIKKIDEVVLPEEGLKNLKNLNSVAKTCEAIAKEENEIVKSGEFPVFIGGDHSAAIGTISGVAKTKRSLGLLWVDSHSDINTDVSTVTGNIHGMPVSAVMGFGNEKLISVFGEEQKVLPQNVVLFGLRDVDPLEAEIIERLGIKTYYYDEIIKKGLKECLSEIGDFFKGTDSVHLSFDLDSMNPEIIKGVTVPVAEGFNLENVREIFDFSLEKLNLSSIDIVEFNPQYDDGLTSDFTYELINKIKDKK